METRPIRWEEWFWRPRRLTGPFSERGERQGSGKRTTSAAVNRGHPLAPLAWCTGGAHITDPPLGPDACIITGAGLEALYLPFCSR